MLGVVLERETLLVGDNMSVVLNTTIPSSSLKKKHLACSYHRVREAIAGGFVNYGHIPSTSNLADIGTKPLSTLVFHRLIDPYQKVDEKSSELISNLAHKIILAESLLVYKWQGQRFLTSKLQGR
jgi:hypothetical protein